MMKTAIALGLALAALGAQNAAAQAIEERNVLRGKQEWDATKGYIFVRTPVRSTGTFIRIPSEQEISQYRQDWEAAYAEAEAKHQRALKRYEGDLEWARKQRQNPPPAPVGPSRETFQFPPLIMRQITGFGPQFRYGSEENSSEMTYLTSVVPGTYIWYGPASAAGDGLCYCMGSVRFEVAAGVITNLGNALQAPADAGVLPEAGNIAFAKSLPTLSATPANYDLPASLANGPAARTPEFSASGKVDNIFGGMITRLAPIDGVLAYQRDRVIDVRTGQEVARPEFDPPAS